MSAVDIRLVKIRAFSLVFDWPKYSLCLGVRSANICAFLSVVLDRPTYPLYLDVRLVSIRALYSILHWLTYTLYLDVRLVNMCSFYTFV